MLTRDDLAKLRACGSGFKSKKDYETWVASASECWEELIDLAANALREPADGETIYKSATALEIPESVQEFESARNLWIAVSMWQAAERYHGIVIAEE